MKVTIDPVEFGERLAGCLWLSRMQAREVIRAAGLEGEPFMLARTAFDAERNFALRHDHARELRAQCAIRGEK